MKKNQLLEADLNIISATKNHALDISFFNEIRLLINNLPKEDPIISQWLDVLQELNLFKENIFEQKENQLYQLKESLTKDNLVQYVIINYLEKYNELNDAFDQLILSFYKNAYDIEDGVFYQDQLERGSLTAVNLSSINIKLTQAIADSLTRILNILENEIYSKQLKKLAKKISGANSYALTNMLLGNAKDFGFEIAIKRSIKAINYVINSYQIDHKFEQLKDHRQLNYVNLNHFMQYTTNLVKSMISYLGENADLFKKQMMSRLVDFITEQSLEINDENKTERIEAILKATLKTLGMLMRYSITQLSDFGRSAHLLNDFILSLNDIIPNPLKENCKEPEYLFEGFELTFVPEDELAVVPH